MPFTAWRKKIAAKALVIHAIFSLLAVVAVIEGFRVMGFAGGYDPTGFVMAVLMVGGLFLIYPLSLIAAVLSLFDWWTLALLLLMFVFLHGVNEKSVILTLLYPLATLGVFIRRYLHKKALSH